MRMCACSNSLQASSLLSHEIQVAIQDQQHAIACSCTFWNLMLDKTSAASVTQPNISCVHTCFSSEATLNASREQALGELYGHCHLAKGEGSLPSATQPERTQHRSMPCDNLPDACLAFSQLWVPIWPSMIGTMPARASAQYACRVSERAAWGSPQPGPCPPQECPSASPAWCSMELHSTGAHEQC